MTFQTSATFAAAKKNRVPVTEIDVRGADAAKKLGRVRPAAVDRSARGSSFNSAL
ncbi:FXSXX-COOH protein [Streptomyces sp. NPDC059909]|uniref:FXSXX-COOH protein n=1 Tax=Streptomyces sp. NPDC059909 TaxID=3346998 RepID=UPI0036655B91